MTHSTHPGKFHSEQRSLLHSSPLQAACTTTAIKTSSDFLRNNRGCSWGKMELYVVLDRYISLSCSTVYTAICSVYTYLPLARSPDVMLVSVQKYLLPSGKQMSAGVNDCPTGPWRLFQVGLLFNEFSIYLLYTKKDKEHRVRPLIIKGYILTSTSSLTKIILCITLSIGVAVCSSQSIPINLG